MEIEKDLKDCFKIALIEEEKGKKHKGLLIGNPSQKYAEEFVIKAKKNLRFCNICKEEGFDYKLPEEWFYILYYCALAILAKFGVDSRSQRCTAHFLRYIKDVKLIEYDEEYIKRITVFKEKGKTSDVDEREKARYGPSIEINEIAGQYDKMMELCKNAISQCEEIVYSNNKFEIPKELLQDLNNKL